MLGIPSSTRSNKFLLQNRPPAIVLDATAITPLLPLRRAAVDVYRSSAMEAVGRIPGPVLLILTPVDGVTPVYFFGTEDNSAAPSREPAVDRGGARNRYSTLVDPRPPICSLRRGRKNRRRYDHAPTTVPESGGLGAGPVYIPSPQRPAAETVSAKPTIPTK
jgi:hypothetical protein